MKFRIIGSGGMYPTPLADCHCKVCESARSGNKYDIRSMPALYIEDIKLLIDTPEDIFNTISSNKIEVLKVDMKKTESGREEIIINTGSCNDKTGTC